MPSIDAINDIQPTQAKSHTEPAAPETPCMSNLRSRPGWNASHPHQTRFKARLQVNYTCVQARHPNIMAHNPEDYTIQDQFQAMITHIENVYQHEDGTMNYHYPCVFSTSTEHKDTLNYGEMLQTPDRPQFETAMQSEMDGLHDVFKVVLRTSVPEGVKPLPAVWAFKRKRLPDWSIIKWKAQINIHGGQQQHGVNFWET